MKISAFNPLILTAQASDAVKLFEELGFEKRHTKTGISDADVTAFDLKDANGFRVNVAQVDSMPQAMTVIRMNVDNFEEAYEFLTARGFKNPNGNKATETGTSRATLMVSPSGFAISLSQHIKK